MSYKYIAIRGRTKPLATVLTEAYEQGVKSETRLANAAPDLLFACRNAEACLALLADPSLGHKARQNYLDIARYALNCAIERATGTEVQS